MSSPARAVIITLLAGLIVWLVSLAPGHRANLPSCDDGSSMNRSEHIHTHRNRLAGEKSPYLLQHAGNPVDWYPWGDEAFAAAKAQNKPVFLSIGYSTCHWCHVMEHESFEDSAVATLMNNAFVSIKVDREERPDIDNLYMGVCQMMTGSGGWPLTIIMTPDKKPFYAATYIPRENAYGRLGMLELIPRIADFWRDRRDEAEGSADHICELVRDAARREAGAALSRAEFDSAAMDLRRRFDPQFGGFGRAPKFPSPHNLTLLLRHWKRTGDSTSLMMVERTLNAMRAGGIYDHIGFGFHRYSTDQEWLVPHFEKMLYDQAMLAIAYTEAYQATGKSEYATVVAEIISYVLRDLTSTEGAFYSAEDADSEDEEGKFYVWTLEEIGKALSFDDAHLAAAFYNFADGGNFIDQATRERTGANIPHTRQPLSEFARSKGISTDLLLERLDSIRPKLLAVRSRRIRPHLDDKVLTDWNGLMIAALAKASMALDRPDYAAIASRGADFVLTHLRGHDGRLLHRYRDGDAGLPAHVDDYSFFIWGLIELYEATADIRYLETALDLNNYFIAHFWDDAYGGFFFTADDGEPLLARQKEVYDGAIPSGNSVAMMNLVRLGRMTGDRILEIRAESTGRAFADQVRGTPSAHAQMLQAVDFLAGPSQEIVVCSTNDSDGTERMLRALRGRYLPTKVLLVKPDTHDAQRLTKLAEYTSSMSALSGRATVYVCRDFACQQPTTDVEQMLRYLEDE